MVSLETQVNERRFLMTNSNKKKREQLGMPQGTASNRLRKELMFQMAVKLGDNVCYQCGELINSSAELSVEHKVPWLDSEDPVKLFFDLDNVAFSHLSCNCRAARRRESELSEEERKLRYNSKRREVYRSKPKEQRKAERRARYLRTGN